MAQQEIAQDSEQAAAAMAAESVAADIDTIIGAEEPAGTPGMMPDMGDGAAARTPGATTYLVVKELRSISRAHSLRPGRGSGRCGGRAAIPGDISFLDIMLSATRSMASFSRSGATG